MRGAMDERATGLLLRTYPLTESSLIVHWLTREQGRIATVAKGALRPKSSFRGKLDLFFLCELSFLRSRRSELHTLKEVTLIDSEPALRHDLSLLRRAAYASSLIQQTTESDSPVPEIYELLFGFVRALPRSGSALPVLAFEIKLLRLLGLAPDAAAAELSAGSKRSLTYLSESEWEMLERFKLSQIQFQELRRFLHGFLIYHLGKFPPGRTQALEESTGATSRASKSSAG